MLINTEKEKVVKNTRSLLVYLQAKKIKYVDLQLDELAAAVKEMKNQYRKNMKVLGTTALLVLYTVEAFLWVESVRPIKTVERMIASTQKLTREYKEDQNTNKESHEWLRF